MILNRVAGFYALHKGVATGTEIVNIAVKLILIIGSMGTVADDTPPGTQDAMHIKALTGSTDILLHIRVAGDTELRFTISPKLITVALTMGIVANSAITGPNWAMNMGHIFPFPLINMATKAQLFDITFGDGHLTLALTFVTRSAEEIGRRTMSPLGTGNRLGVTRIADRGKLAKEARINWGIGR